MEKKSHNTRRPPVGSLGYIVRAVIILICLHLGRAQFEGQNQEAGEIVLNKDTKNYWQERV